MLSSLTSSELEQVDELLRSIEEPWLPQPGPQTLAYYSEADELFYGGAAGGGKTDLLLGLAATQHIVSVIFRREYPQLESLVDRSEEVLGKLGTLNKGRYIWRIRYKHFRKIEFRAMANPTDAKKFQGRPHDLKAYDEICHFTMMQFLFTKAWNRTTYPGQRCRIVAAGNPPTDAQGRWVIDYWAPWLSEKYPYPANAGELRWFITAESKSYEVGGPGKFRFKGVIYESKSRTFIPAMLQDNWYLSDSGYSATLSSLPEPLRSQLLYGDFKAGIKDDPWQLFPTEWVRAAMERWRKHAPIPIQFMEQIGVDVSRGGSDRTVLTGRWRNYFFKQVEAQGVTTSDGMKVVDLVLVNSPPGAAVGVDAIGVGSSVLDIMRLKRKKVMALVGSAASTATDRSGLLGFNNKRSEWFWKLRESLDPESGDNLAIPDDSELLSELVSIRWKSTIRGVQVESKEDVIENLGRSPDKMDSLVYAHAREEMSGGGIFEYMKQQKSAEITDTVHPLLEQMIKNRPITRK